MGWIAMLLVGAAAEAAGIAEKYEAEEDWAAALGAYLAVLERSPKDAAARKGAWRAATRLGLFEQAASLGASLDENERAREEGDRIAVEIRHGRIDVNSLKGPERFRRIDAALARTDDLAAGFLGGAEVDAEGLRRLVDRLSALWVRNRPADVVKLYEALEAKGKPVPAFALSDVAGAYLSLRKPETAEMLYRKTLAESPDSFDANLGLFYALVESEKHDEAAAHIDAFAQRSPSRRRRDTLTNAERRSAEVAGDQARIYADRLDEAQQRIERHLDETPFNGEVRSAEASLHFSRGWTREGEADVRRNLGRDPDSVGLHVDRAEALLTLQRWEEARAELAVAQSVDPASAPVRRATESFGLHDRRELYVEAGYGHGESTDPHGTRDYRIDAWLYSSPLAEQWRAFLHHYNSWADFDSSSTRWIRTGAGLEWRQGDWRATGEANGGSGEKVGVLGTLRWQASDFWQLYGSAESLANEMPLQAVRANLTAERATFGVDWRASERRKLGVALTAMDFSDDNRRRGASFSWFERWVSGPRWIFESTAGIDATENSLGTAAAYFNPPRDRSVWASGTVDYLTSREYDRSFRQRLTVSLGDYWESGFGSGGIKAIEYQHRWELGRDLSLRYSIARLVRPYDGVQEARNLATLTVLWRF
ncbi:MAG TPA: poly-beta-1,6 N-acetyl-D-glucosamine export porin PgaA [Burkholderiales bacterium]